MTATDPFLPDPVDHPLSHEGIAFFEQEKWNDSARCFAELVKQYPGSPQPHYCLGLVLTRKMQFLDALNHLTRALSMDPNSVNIQAAMGNALCGMARAPKAVICYRKALSIEPDRLDIWLLLSNAYSLTGEFAKAEEAVREVIRRDPKNKMAWQSLCILIERQNKTEELGKETEAALTLFPDDGAVLVARARYLRQKKQIEEAEACLNKALEQEKDMPVTARNHMWDELAVIYDRTGRYGEAFEAMRHCHDAAKESFMYGARKMDHFPREIASNVNFLRQLQTKISFPSVGEDGVATPVFLVGFPRSGTTLCEQILSAHPDFIVSDERQMTSEIINNLQHLLSRNLVYPHELLNLDREDVCLLRRRYWDLVKELCVNRIGEAEWARLRDPADPLTLIDKNPFNLNTATFITRLFPEARFLAVIRDPRDAVTSCYLQNFNINTATIHMMQPDTAADIYTRAMQSWELAKEKIDFTYYQFRYEDLVADFERIAREMVAATGRDWDPEVLRYYEEKHRRTVSTPSIGGVSSPIYSKAVARWRNYKPYMADAFTKLTPWVERYGYEV